MDCSWIEPEILAAGSIPIGLKDLQSLHSQGIRAILSLTNRVPTTFQEITLSLLQKLDITYFHEPIPDQCPPNPEQAERILQFIRNIAAQKRPLFVHCSAGVGRTGTILHLYYLAQGKSYQEAQTIIKARRIQCILLSAEQVEFLKHYSQSIEPLLPGNHSMHIDNLKTRPAKKEDAEILAKIHVDSWKLAYRNLVPDSFLERFTYEKRTRAFIEALENRSEETYIAEIDGKAVGFLTIGNNRDDDLDKARIGEIWGIYLDPTCWRNGIGTRLLKEAENKLLSKRYNELVLWVFRDNWNARKFYEKMGYFPDGKEKILTLDKELVIVRCRKKFNP